MLSKSKDPLSSNQCSVAICYLNPKTTPPPTSPQSVYHCNMLSKSKYLSPNQCFVAMCYLNQKTPSPHIRVSLQYLNQKTPPPHPDSNQCIVAICYLIPPQNYTPTPQQSTPFYQPLPVHCVTATRPGSLGAVSPPGSLGAVSPPGSLGAVSRCPLCDRQQAWFTGSCVTLSTL